MLPSKRRDSLSAEEFRDVIGRFASGVTVITTSQLGAPFGTTASAVSSLSVEPPMLLICMNKDSATGRAVGASRHFAVNILGEDQPDLAVTFASKGGDKFATVPTTPGALGDPLIDTALATLECHVSDEAAGGTHTVFLAEVKHASARPGSPLAYFRGQFGRLQLEQDESAYWLLRSRVLMRELPIGQPLDLDDLAAQLETPRSSVYYALAELTGEGLAVREPEGFVIRAVTAAAVESALAARQAILLGVIALTIHRVDRGQLADLRTYVRDIPVKLSFDEWRRALLDLQRRLINLSGSPALVEAFLHANVALVIAGQREPAASEAVRAALLAEYRDLLDALDAGDLRSANDAVHRIIVHAREVRRVFASSDGV